MFFRKLGPCYKKVLQQRGNIYRDVRCGLAHAYLIEQNAYIVIEGGNCGILYDEESKQYTFGVKRYLEDFKKAVGNYIDGLETGAESLKNVEEALQGKPELI
jgi:hypothetical protein